MAAPVRAQEGPTCFGRPATIYEPDANRVVGTPGADVIVGAPENLYIEARGGDDLVCQGDAEYLERAEGGGGDDMLADEAGTGGDNYYVGGRGDDLIDIREYNRLIGGPGDDRLLGGYDQKGGTGADVLVHRPGIDDDISMEGGPGPDVLDSRRGIATADYARAHGVWVDLGAGTAVGWGRDELIAVENVRGSRFDDVLIGSDGTHRTRHSLSRSNDMEGGPGDDVIHGRGGGDWIDAGLGEDVVAGGGGNDDIDTGEHAIGQRTPNVAHGGAGDDRLNGGQGPDRLSGGRGDDRIDGQYGRNVVRGGEGDDLLSYGGRRESIGGGRGFDIADFSVFGPVLVDLRDQTARSGRLRIRMRAIEGVFGSYFGDTLIGNHRRNLLFDGGNYNVDEHEDLLYGLRGDDVLAIYGDATDNIEDELFVADGGPGSDTVFFAAAFEGARVNLARGRAWLGDSPGYLRAIENAIGTPYADTLVGDEAANRLRGRRGDDTLTGANGDDELDGGPGTDVLDGGAGHDACSEGETETSCEDAARAFGQDLRHFGFDLTRWIVPSGG
ncbi:MAG TPA: calcium-binding protein [Actinomycetota bacterium]|nr:calcium-binding protein [Actinomycetota bacterium]